MTERTVRLSDGSVWERVPNSSNLLWQWRASEDSDEPNRYGEIPRRLDGEALTASDHRAIADVLEPPSGRVPTPTREQVEALATYVGMGSAMVSITSGTPGPWLSRDDVLALFSGPAHEDTRHLEEKRA